MRHQAFESALAFHCGPALAGIKAANLISLSRREFPDVDRLIQHYRAGLKRGGILLRTVCGCGGRVLLLVYREEKLSQQLRDPEIAAILRDAGYPQGGVETQLSHLETRLGGEDFPHEIGAFLGYPPADIRGFQQHRGQNCKYCGVWKVYSDVESARKSFQRYERCRNALCRRIRQGRSITELFCAG